MTQVSLRKIYYPLLRSTFKLPLNKIWVLSIGQLIKPQKLFSMLGEDLSYRKFKFNSAII